MLSLLRPHTTCVAETFFCFRETKIFFRNTLFPKQALFTRANEGTLFGKHLRNEETWHKHKMFAQQCCRICARKQNLSRKQNVCEKDQKRVLFLFLRNKKMFPQQILCVRANGEAFRQTMTSLRQNVFSWFLVCGGLYAWYKNSLLAFLNRCKIYW